MNKKYILTLLIGLVAYIIMPLNLLAQSNDSTATEVLPDTLSVEIPKKEKKPKKEKMSDSTKMMLNFIKKGDKIFNADNKRYDLAIEQYQSAELLGSEDVNMLYNIGVSYFKLKKYKEAKPYFEEITDVDSVEINRALYYLGRINHLQYEFDTAMTYYDKYYKSLNPQELDNNRKDITKRKKDCESAKVLYANPVNSYIDIIDTNINTNYVEYAPIISTNDSLLVFTSRRPEGKGENRDHLGRFYEKVYYSVKDSVGNWTKAKAFGKSINGSDHSAAAGISADGKKMLVYKSSNNGDLYVSSIENGEWQKTKKLNGYINTDAHESAGSFSYDRLKLYFSSDRVGGYGGHDLYVSNLNEDEKWGEPENLKAKINTVFDEISIVALPDGKTFYFTSNGHNTMGGFDIFKITYEDSAWSDPVNLGYPINTPDDDILFSVTADGKGAYIASSRTDSSLHDIYMVSFATEIKTVKDQLDGDLLVIQRYGVSLPAIEAAINIKQMNLTVLKGTIYDQFTKEPIYANIELTDNSINKVIATFNSNEQTGQYLVSLPSGKDYGIAVKAENCLFYSENITIKKSKGYNEIIKDINLQRIAVGSKVVLKNLFFASGKAKITKSSETELQNLLKLLNDNPSLKLEIAGHTDDVGRASNNKKLSKRRATAVVNYLVKNGIAADRLVAKGYGEDSPIADNKTKEGRSKNRRTEFEVIAR